MVSNTGCKSVGELAMTRRISLVAVCCSNASRSSELNDSNSPVFRVSSWNNRVFSMAITAWSAKIFTKADLLIGER